MQRGTPVEFSERAVLQLRCVVEDDRQHTLRQAARVLGVSREGVRQQTWHKLQSASEIWNLPSAAADWAHDPAAHPYPRQRHSRRAIVASASSARDGGASAEGKDDDSPSPGWLRLASALTPSSAAILGPSVRLPGSRLYERALPYGTLFAGAETFPLSRVGLCHHAILLRPQGCPIIAFIRFSLTVTAFAQ